MRVIRVISNNAVLAAREDDEIVVLGRGVGFGLKAGEPIVAERIEQVFLAENASDDRLSLMLADIPSQFLRLAGRIADLAQAELGIRATESLILPLADHLAFAAQRAEAGIRMEFPLAWEVSQLYPAEFSLAERAVRLSGETLHVELDEDEAVAVAMHLVNAQFTAPGHARSMMMTETIGRAFIVIERSFALRIDRRSMSCTRFVTHLRYLFARVASDSQLADPNPTLFEAIANAHPDAMTCASKVRYLIDAAFDTTLTTDEVAYLGLHIARLVVEHRRTDSKPRLMSG